MLLVQLDTGLIVLSFLALLGTLAKVFSRSSKEARIAENVHIIKKQLKRKIGSTVAHDEPEAGLWSSVQNWVGKKKTIGEKNDTSFVDTKKTLRKADVFLSRNDFANAEKYLIEALSLDGENKEINKKLALMYLKQEKYPKAELIYLRLIEQGTNDPAIYSNLGLVLYHEQRFDMAIKAYQKAIELDPNRAARFANIGQIYYELKDVKNALAHFEQAVSLEPKNVDYLFILAKLYEENNAREKAKTCYHKILDIAPYNEEAKAGIQSLL